MIMVLKTLKKSNNWSGNHQFFTNFFHENHRLIKEITSTIGSVILISFKEPDPAVL